MAEESIDIQGYLSGCESTAVVDDGVDAQWNRSYGTGVAWIRWEYAYSISVQSFV